MAIDPNVAAAINTGENEYRQKVLGQGPLPGHDELQHIPVIRPELRALFDSVAAIGFDLSLFECRVPDAERALRLWANDQGLSVVEEDRVTPEDHPMVEWRGMRVSVIRVRLPRDLLTITVHRDTTRRAA